MGNKTLTNELGLPNYSYIRRWVKNYKDLSETGLDDRRGKPNFLLKADQKPDQCL
ncbi:helix-turn-helix domain-containing protein [Heyndrickxia sp. NPDC080065]|uniref:helix-turn-helix domain-containing protein n=1 Tax=Heyndrickxia sp. NPDC080065 TaxID=3390568 RepID=UPI003D06A1CE